MNTYYQQNGRIGSNNDIFETYFYGETKALPSWKKRLDTILAILAAMVASLTSARARTALRVFGVGASLVGFVGIIGAMEAGSLAILPGILIGILLIGVEVLCLRRATKH